MFMGPAVDLRTKPPDVGILEFRTEFEVRAAERNSSTE